MCVKLVTYFAFSFVLGDWRVSSVFSTSTDAWVQYAKVLSANRKLNLGSCKCLLWASSVHDSFSVILMSFWLLDTRLVKWLFQGLCITVLFCFILIHLWSFNCNLNMLQQVTWVEHVLNVGSLLWMKMRVIKQRKLLKFSKSFMVEHMFLLLICQSGCRVSKNFRRDVQIRRLGQEKEQIILLSAKDLVNDLDE